jgi:hypothetical protein
MTCDHYSNTPQPDYEQMSSNPGAHHAHYRNNCFHSPHGAGCPSCHLGEKRPTAYPAEDHGTSRTTPRAPLHKKLRGAIEDTRSGSCVSLTTPRSYRSNQSDPVQGFTTWRTTMPVRSDPGNDLPIDHHCPIQEPNLEEPTESRLQALTEITDPTTVPTSLTSTTTTIRWCRKSFPFSFYYFH